MAKVIIGLLTLFFLILFILLVWIIFFTIALLFFAREGKKKGKTHVSPV